jgi:hypothetical protein
MLASAETGTFEIKRSQVTKQARTAGSSMADGSTYLMETVIATPTKSIKKRQRSLKHSSAEATRRDIRVNMEAT